MVNKTAATIVASTSNAAAATTRGTIDLRTVDYGGLLTIKITNGATGPTLACEVRVLIAHNDGATPAAASAGADWKTDYIFNGGTTADEVTEQSYNVDPGVQHLEIEFTGNTGQAVTVEAQMTKVSA